MPDQSEALHVRLPLEVDAELVLAARRGRRQRLQVLVDDLLEPLAGRRLAEAEGVLRIDVDRQRDVAVGGQVLRQVAKAPVVRPLVRRIARPAVDMVDLRAARMRAVQDDDDRERAFARRSARR